MRTKFLVATAVGLHLAEGVVVGVDFGNAFTKVAVAVPGRAVDIALNHHSKRKTPTAISFVETTRTFGEEAIQHASKRVVSDVFKFLPELIAFDNSNVYEREDFAASSSSSMLGGAASATSRSSGKDSAESKSGTLSEKLASFSLFSSSPSGKADVLVEKKTQRRLPPALSPVALFDGATDFANNRPLYNISRLGPEIAPPTSIGITAHWFQYLKKLVAEFVNSSSSAANNVTLDAVVTIPSRASMLQKRAVVDAAEIGGVSVLGLVTDVSAAALHHLRDLPANFTGIKMFIDVGATSTQVCLVHFAVEKKKRSGKLMGCETSSSVGGAFFDLALAQFIRGRAETALGGRALTPRAEQRLIKEVERAKLVLSANRKVDFNIPSLQDGVDFHTSITREEFESVISAAVTTEIPLLINTLLQHHNVTLAAINGSELIGAGWRVPLVQKVLEEQLTPLSLGQHINGDEAAALGAAWTAANASLSFQIRNLQFSDISSAYSYSVAIHGPKEQTLKELVPSGARWGGFRTVRVRGCKDLVVDLFERRRRRTDSTEKEKDVDNGVKLVEWTLTGVEKACKDDKYAKWGDPRITISFATPLTGIINIKSATATWEETIRELVPPKPTEKPPKAAGNGDGKTDQNGTPNSTATPAAASSSTSSTTTLPPNVTDSSQTNSTTNSTTSSTTTPQPQYIEKIKKHVIQLTVNERYVSEPMPLSVDEKQIAKRQIAWFTEIDRNATRLAETQNSLESYLYNSRSELRSSERVAAVTTPEMREDMIAQFDEVEDWVYTDPAVADIAAVQDKLSKLRGLFEPVVERANEKDARASLAALIREVGKELSVALAADAPKIEDDEKRSKLTTDWQALEAEHAALVAKQAAVLLWETPAFRASELTPRVTAFRHRVRMAVMTAQLEAEKAREEALKKAKEDQEETFAAAAAADSEHRQKSSSGNSSDRPAAVSTEQPVSLEKSIETTTDIPSSIPQTPKTKDEL